GRPARAAVRCQGAALAAWGKGQGHPPGLEKARGPRGAPLSPPIHAFVCYPLALLLPQPAYRVCQVANLVLALVAALGISRLADGRVWWPVAITAIILYPGFKASINLGQNATLSLAILTWGWVLMTRGRPGWGGLVWALL